LKLLFKNSTLYAIGPQVLWLILM